MKKLTLILALALMLPILASCADVSAANAGNSLDVGGENAADRTSEHDVEDTETETSEYVCELTSERDIAKFNELLSMKKAMEAAIVECADQALIEKANEYIEQAHELLINNATAIRFEVQVNRLVAVMDNIYAELVPVTSDGISDPTTPDTYDINKDNELLKKAYEAVEGMPGYASHIEDRGTGEYPDGWTEDWILLRPGVWYCDAAHAKVDGTWYKVNFYYLDEVPDFEWVDRNDELDVLIDADGNYWFLYITWLCLPKEVIDRPFSERWTGEWSHGVLEYPYNPDTESAE